MYLQMEEMDRSGNQGRGGRSNQGQFNGNNNQRNFNQGGQQYGNNSDRGRSNNRGQQYGQNRNNFNNNNYQDQQYQPQGNQGYNNNNSYRNQSPREDFYPNSRNYPPNQQRNDYPRNNYNNNNNQNSNFREGGNASFGQNQQNRNYNSNYGNNRGAFNQNFGNRNNRNFDNQQNQGQRNNQGSWINTQYDDDLEDNGYMPPQKQANQQPYQQQQQNQGFQPQQQRNNYQNRQPRNNYQQNNSFGGNNQRGRQNFSEGGGNQRRQYRNFDRDQPPKEVSQQDMLFKLSFNSNVLIQNYKEFNFPPAASVDNLHQAYVTPNNEPNRVTRVNETAITSLRGAKKLEPFSNAGVNNFYAFPTMPNKGEQQRDKVQGFKEATGIKYSDFQRRGTELMLDILKSFESANR